jgi:hypothetical protein
MVPVVHRDPTPPPVLRKYSFLITREGSFFSKLHKYELYTDDISVLSVSSKKHLRNGGLRISPALDLVVSNNGTVFMVRASDGTQKLLVLIEFHAPDPTSPCRRLAKIQFSKDPALPRSIISLPDLSDIDDRPRICERSNKNLSFAVHRDSNPVLTIKKCTPGQFDVITTLEVDANRLFGILIANEVAKIPKSAHIFGTPPRHLTDSDLYIGHLGNAIALGS